MTTQLISYRWVNGAALGLALYSLALPLCRLLPAWAAAFLPRCAWRVLLGRPCPLCGMTRALAALARGDVQGAGAHHALVLPAALLLACELVGRTLMLGIGARHAIPRRVIRLDLWLHVTLLGLYLVYAVLFLV